MLDPAGLVSTWNTGAERISGYAAAEIIGQHFSCFYPPDDVAAGKPERALAEAIEHGRIEEEGWRLRKDGTRFWANVVITALRTSSGELRGFGKVTRDVTERRADDEALRQSEQRFHGLVDAVTDYAVFMLDHEGRVATWNSGARKAKGYEEAEILGRHFSIFYPEAERAAGRPDRLLDEVRREGRVEDEGWRVRRDGSRFWANVVITRLLDSKGEVVGFAKVTRDLTERREADEAQRGLIVEQAARAAAERSARRAEEANRIKDEFLATVSHELRTPLNAIVGWSKMLLSRDLEPMAMRGVAVIDRNAEAQARLVDDILDASRIITGKLRIELRVFDLVQITREAIEVVRPSSMAKKIELALTSSDETCPMVGDPERIRQVAWNLLSNAVKFTEAGGRVTARVEREGSTAVLRVEDTGRGIASSFLPFVFDRFKQEESSTARRVGGLGLGLAIVRHIVELHGGSVSAESELGKGSTFMVRLPIRSLAPGEVARDPRPATALGMTQPLRGLRALVVDDDDDSRDLVSAVLTEAGAISWPARSAPEALALFFIERPDVVISDIGMPEQDGYDLIRRLRTLPPSEGGALPMVALTAYTRAEDRAKALAAGFSTHVGKPVNPEDLVKVIARITDWKPWTGLAR